ncbi:7-cyano-7-deazaguanine synthase [Candidatus Roizmanbacteria bacterium]|nr:7-cyano-7-deazaguanine synthase [Candidatus Roizmanbacteria bacterium]
MVYELQPKLTEQASLLEGLQRKTTNSIVLLYSGGADSTVTGLKLLEKGFSVHPVFFRYGQTAEQAEEYMATIGPPELGFEKTHIIEMTDLMLSLSKSSLLGGKARDDKDAWVPARNSIFMLLAGVYAYQIDADGIAVGYMLEDQGVFGDSNIMHHKLTELLLTQTLSRPMKVFTPLMSMTKLDVLRYLLDKRSLQFTISCWNAELDGKVVKACHECANCQERDARLQELLGEIKGEMNDKDREYLRTIVNI